MHQFAFHPSYDYFHDDWRQDDEWRVQQQQQQQQQPLLAESEAVLDKDWAVECTHLYQHVHLAQVTLTRNMVGVTSCGWLLRYELPRALVALVVDRLTARHVVDWVRYGEDGRSSTQDKVDFLTMRYDHFPYRSSPLQPTSVRITSHTVCWPPQPPPPPPPPPPSSCPPPRAVQSSTSIEASAVEAAPLWVDRRREEEWVEELGQVLNQHLKDEEWVRRELPELLVLGDDRDVTFPIAHALWVGPQLRRAVEEAHGRRTTSGAQLGREAEVVVELEQCPVVQVPLRVTYWTAEPYPLPRLLAPSVGTWMEQGGLRDWNQPVGGNGLEVRTEKGRRLVREWLGSQPLQGEGQQSGTGGQEEEKVAGKWWDADRYEEQMALLQANWWRMLRRAAAAMRCRGCDLLLSSHGDDPSVTCDTYRYMLCACRPP